MNLYRRVSAIDISKETDVAVILVAGNDGPMALVSDPSLALATRYNSVPDALLQAQKAISHDLNPRELVVVDENGLWDSAWGALVPHPDR